MGRDWSLVESSLQGIDRYNPDNIPILEEYVQYQINERQYNLDANLALLKLYQFNPNHFQTLVTAHVLLKALTNLPRSDFLLCKCLIEYSRVKLIELFQRKCQILQEFLNLGF
jgi:translation initiation factor 3 subunit K